MQLTPQMKKLAREYAIKRLIADGHKKIALYGAGQHTERFIEQLAPVEGLKVVLLLDDSYSEPAIKYNLPVKSVAAFEDQDADVVLISSDTYENAIWKASEPLRKKDIPVYRIYELSDDESLEDDPHGHDSYENIFRSVAHWNPEAIHMRQGLFEKNAIIYHRYSRKHIHDVLYRTMKRYITADAEILDVGSGRGWDTNRMSEHFSSAKITGMEYSPMGVNISQQYEGSRLRFVQGDATAMPFADDSFDALYSLATIEHVSGPERMIRECYRVLKPGGFLLVSTHPKQYWQFWLKRHYEKELAAGSKFEFHGIPIENLAGDLSQTGFEPVEFGCTAFVIYQEWYRYFQGIDFKKLFVLQALAGWVYRGVGQDKRLYYQYHLVRKPGGPPIKILRENPWKKRLHRLIATPLYWILEPIIKAARDRLSQDE